MRRDLLVYLAGPLTSTPDYPAVHNIKQAVDIYLQLLSQDIPAICPHLAGAFSDAWTIVSYEQWIAYDLLLLERCTHVLMLPRWQSSPGARREYDHAIKLQKPIVWSIDEIC